MKLRGAGQHGGLNFLGRYDAGKVRQTWGLPARTVNKTCKQI